MIVTMNEPVIHGDINEISAHINEVAKTHKDFSVPMSGIKYDPIEDGFLVQQKGQWEAWEFSKHAVQQLNAKLGIPSQYMDRCPPFLKDHNYKYWFGRTSAKESLLRTTERDNEPRLVDGVLSKNVYTIIDNKHIIDGLKRHLYLNDRISLEFDGRNMYANITSDKSSLTCADGTVIKGGFHVFNSEVGNGSATAEILMCNSVDGTGIISRGWGGYRQAHRHKNSAQAIGELKKALTSLTSNMSGAIQEAGDLINVKCLDPDGLKDFLCDSAKPSLVNQQREAIDDAFVSYSDDHGCITYWDVVQAFAKASGNTNLSVANRTDIMRIAGRVINEAKTKLKIFRA